MLQKVASTCFVRTPVLTFFLDLAGIWLWCLGLPGTEAPTAVKAREKCTDHWGQLRTQRERERESEREREWERGAKHIGVCIWMYLVYLQKAAGLFSDMFEGSPTRVESNVRINHAILAHFGYAKCYLQSKPITNQQPIIIFQTLINNPSIHFSMYIDAYIHIHIYVNIVCNILYIICIIYIYIYISISYIYIIVYIQYYYLFIIYYILYIIYYLLFIIHYIYIL